MPYPRQHSGRRWHECDECGLDYPLAELHRDYTGLLKCHRCYDPIGWIENRQDIIMKVEETTDEVYFEDVL
jgi:hypothetical protein